MLIPDIKGFQTDQSSNFGLRDQGAHATPSTTQWQNWWSTAGRAAVPVSASGEAASTTGSNTGAGTWIGWFFSPQKNIICYLHGTNQMKQPKGLGFPRLMLINHNCWYFSSARFADIDSGSNKAEMLRKLRATEWFKGGAWDDGLSHSDILYQGDPSKKWTKTPKKPWFNRGILTHTHTLGTISGVFTVFSLFGEWD